MENVNYISQFLGRRVAVRLNDGKTEFIGTLCNNPRGNICGEEYAIMLDNGITQSLATGCITEIITFQGKKDYESMASKNKNEVKTGSNDNDLVNHPSHYTSGKYEVIEVIKDKLSPEQFEGYCIGNVMKYIMRYQHKNGLEDLQKGLWYLNKIVEVKRGKVNG